MQSVLRGGKGGSTADMSYGTVSGSAQPRRCDGSSRAFRALLGSAILLCAGTMILSAHSRAGRAVAPVALSAFLPGDDFSPDLRSEEQVAPLEDPNYHSGEGEWIALNPGDDDLGILGYTIDPGLERATTGRVFELENKVLLVCCVCAELFVSITAVLTMPTCMLPLRLQFAVIKMRHVDTLAAALQV